MAFSTHDQVPDSPTNVFATLNPLDAGSNLSFADGNCRITSTTNPNNNTKGSIAVTSGKYYFEYVITGGNASSVVGIGGQSTSVSSNFSGDLYAYDSSGNKNINGTSSSYNQSFGVGDIIGVFFNLDSLEITFLKNNSSQGVITGITANKTWTAFAHVNTATGHVNFGQDSSFGGYKTSGSANAQDANGIGSFYYQPPTGALALCTANLPDPAIDPAVDDLPADYMKAVTYTGSGNTLQNIDVGFDADLYWIKSRQSNVDHHLIDTVRNAGLATNTTAAQISSYGGFTKISTPVIGFSLNINNSNTNRSDSTITDTYVAWCFRAGGSPSGSTSTTGSAKRINTSGTQNDTSCSALATAASATITPTLMSINQKAGFSIVKFNGVNSTGTLPHGLSEAPELVIFKKTSAVSNWIVHRNGDPARKFLYLNNAFGLSDAGADMVTNYSNSVLSLGTDGDVNPSDGVSMIMYAWHSVAGYSAFGSYTGNGSADGPFVYTGFKPAWVMIKSSSYATTTYTSWAIYDNARETYNPNNNVLYANKSINEGKRGDATTAATDIDVDFLSNGFKVRSDKAEINQDTETYIYAAFAEQPFKYANAR